MLARGLAYMGLCFITPLVWLPMRYVGILGFFAVLFEVGWMMRALEVGDPARAAMFACVLLATILFTSSMLWLRVWIMRAWDSVTGTRTIWRW